MAILDIYAQAYLHILHLEKYHFEILNQLWLSCATL